MNRRRRYWPLFLALAMLLLAMLACGGFQVRVTPTPKPTATATESKPAATVPPAKTTASASKAEATATPTATTAPSPTAAPVGLAPGAKVRVAASGGINIRDKASAKGKQVGRLNANAVVTLLEGPTQADKYAWWKVDNGAGVVGWAALGPANDPWLVPVAPAAAATAASNAPKLVDRPIKLGDRVQVTTSTGSVAHSARDRGKDSDRESQGETGHAFHGTRGPHQAGWADLVGAGGREGQRLGGGRERQGSLADAGGITDDERRRTNDQRTRCFVLGQFVLRQSCFRTRNSARALAPRRSSCRCFAASRQR